MTIERHAGQVELVCDDCGESFGAREAADFADMMSDAREKGWRNFQRRGKWQNACPACAGLWLDGMKQQDMFGG